VSSCLAAWEGEEVCLGRSADVCVAGFEGQAHPYKENIVRLGGKASMAQIPEVKAAFAQQASPAQ